MSSTAFLKRFETEVELTPVVGAPNIHVISTKSAPVTAVEEPQMSDGDWDKFEANIDEAFEQLP